MLDSNLQVAERWRQHFAEQEDGLPVSLAPLIALNEQVPRSQVVVDQRRLPRSLLACSRPRAQRWPWHEKRAPGKLGRIAQMTAWHMISAGNSPGQRDRAFPYAVRGTVDGLVCIPYTLSQKDFADALKQWGVKSKKKPGCFSPLPLIRRRSAGL